MENSDKKNKKTRVVGFSLRYKLILIFIGIIASIVLLISVITFHREKQILENELIKMSITLLKSLSSGLSYTGLNEDFKLQAIDTVRSIAVNKDIKFVVVLNPDNRVFISYPRSEVYFNWDEEISIDVIRSRLEKEDIGKEFFFKIKDFLEPNKGYDFYVFVAPILSPVEKDRAIGRVMLLVSNRRLIENINENVKRTIILMAIFIGVGIIISLLFGTMLTRPIIKLAEGARIVGEGNLDYRIDIKRRDEIGFLAKEFNEMTEKLKVAEQLKIEKAIMDEQIEIAKEIQKGLNPLKALKMGCVEIKGYTRPAKGVGGDYYDYVSLEPPWIGALISDVSGKGVPASLIMVMIRTVFVSLIKQRVLSAKRIVESINRAMSSDMTIDRFATLFFMLIDSSSGEVRFVNAGHGPLFMYRKKINRCTVSKLDGFPIGLDEDTEYDQARVFMEEGDIILLNTDGITEARNTKKEEYGRLRLQKLLLKYNHLSAEELVKKIVEDVDAFVGEAPQHDDMTVVVIKRIC